MPARFRQVVGLVLWLGHHPVGAPGPIIPIPPLVLLQRLVAFQIHAVDRLAARDHPFQLLANAFALEECRAGVIRLPFSCGSVFRDGRAVQSAEYDLFCETLTKQQGRDDEHAFWLKNERRLT